MQPKLIQLSVVLPAYREAENLRKLIPQLKSELRRSGLRFEIIVVDTPEPLDDSPQICEQFDVRHVARAPGDCYGDAVRSGIAHSRGQWVVCMDADGSHSPAFIHQLLEHRFEFDVVIASRYVQGGSTHDSFLLAAMSRILNVTYSLVLGLPCKDISNSFRLYDGPLVRGLTLTCSNFDIVEELLVRIRAARGKLRFKELPFRFKTREHGTTKRKLTTFIATYILTMFRLWGVGKSQQQSSNDHQTVDKPTDQQGGCKRRAA